MRAIKGKKIFALLFGEKGRIKKEISSILFNLIFARLHSQKHPQIKSIPFDEKTAIV